MCIRDRQVIVAESDGVVRQPREVSAFRGVLADAAPARSAAAPEPVEPPAAVAETSSSDVDGERRVRDAAADYFRGLVAETLQLPVADIRSDVPFDRYGIDSILVVQLTDAVRRVLDDVGSTLFFEVRDVDGLVAHFLRTQPAALAALVGVTAEEEPAAAAVQASADVAIPAAAPATASPAAATSGTASPAAASPAAVSPAAVSPATATSSAVTAPAPAPAPAGTEPAPADRGTAIAVVGMAGRYPGALSLIHI